jgi:hypothetical protein
MLKQIYKTCNGYLYINYQLDPGLVAENSGSRSGSGYATLAPRNSNFIYAQSINPAEIILFSF